MSRRAALIIVALGAVVGAYAVCLGLAVGVLWLLGVAS